VSDWTPFLSALYRGEPLACTAEQWHGGLRTAVQKHAAKMVDGGQDIYAVIALEEVRRNDAAHGSGMSGFSEPPGEEAAHN